MQPETVLRLAQVPGIVGIKEATGDIDRAAWLIKQAPAGFSIYSGDDQTAIALMLLGGHGNVSVTANVAPRAMHELCMAAIDGRVREATADPPAGCSRCTRACSSSRARRPPSGRCRGWAAAAQRCACRSRRSAPPARRRSSRRCVEAGLMCRHRRESAARATVPQSAEPHAARPHGDFHRDRFPFPVRPLCLALALRARAAAGSIDQVTGDKSRLPHRRQQDRAAGHPARPDPAVARLALCSRRAAASAPARSRPALRHLRRCGRHDGRRRQLGHHCGRRDAHRAPRQRALAEHRR